MENKIKLEIGKKYYIQLWNNYRDVKKVKLLTIGENFVVVKGYFNKFFIRLDQILGAVDNKSTK